MKRFFFFLCCLMAVMGVWAEKYVDAAEQFSIEIPEGWTMTKQGNLYLFTKGEDVMSMYILRAERGTDYSPNDAYSNLKKGDESMHNIKSRRHIWATFYMHYVTRTYEQNGQHFQEYYRIFPKVAYCFRTLENENNDVKLMCARSIRPEPWNFWTQFVIMGRKVGWLLSLIGLVFWIIIAIFFGFICDSYKESPLTYIGLALVWLSIPLLWWGGTQIIIVMYGIALVTYIIECIYHLNDIKKNPKGSVASGTISKANNNDRIVSEKEKARERRTTKIMEVVADKFDDVINFFIG